MADKGYFLSKADVRLLQDMARAYRAGKTSRRPPPQRRRNRGGGGSGGAQPLYGYLKLSIGAGQTVHESVHACERTADGDYVLLFNDAEPEPNPIYYSGRNMNQWSNINYYLEAVDGLELFVWGFGFQKDFNTDPEGEPDIRTVMEIWNPPTQTPMIEGFVLSPGNNIGQTVMHRDGSHDLELRSGPCGGEA